MFVTNYYQSNVIAPVTASSTQIRNQKTSKKQNKKHIKHRNRAKTGEAERNYNCLLTRF